MTIQFFVPGIPAPGGSKNAHAIFNKNGPVMRNGRPLITVSDSGKNNKEWRAVVTLVARAAHIGAPLEGPLSLTLNFSVLRPQNHFGTGRNAGKLKESAPTWPCVKPDVTKLIRAVEDAMTGIIWRDDNQVVAQLATKKYGTEAGVLVTVVDVAEAIDVVLGEAGKARAA